MKVYPYVIIYKYATYINIIINNILSQNHAERWLNIIHPKYGTVFPTDPIRKPKLFDHSWGVATNFPKVAHLMTAKYTLYCSRHQTLNPSAVEFFLNCYQRDKCYWQRMMGKEFLISFMQLLYISIQTNVT